MTILKVEVKYNCKTACRNLKKNSKKTKRKKFLPEEESSKRSANHVSHRQYLPFPCQFKQAEKQTNFLTSLSSGERTFESSRFSISEETFCKYSFEEIIDELRRMDDRYSFESQQTIFIVHVRPARVFVPSLFK